MENPDTRQETPGTRRVGSRIVYYLDCSFKFMLFYFDNRRVGS